MKTCSKNFCFSFLCGKTLRLILVLVFAGTVVACSSAPKRPFASVDPANSSSVETLSIPPEYKKQAVLQNNSGVQDDAGLLPQDMANPPTLEQRVSRLEKDFYALYPNLTNLVAIEKDMQDLVAELSLLVDQEQEEKTSPHPSTTATPQPAENPPARARPIADDGPVMLSQGIQHHSRIPEISEPDIVSTPHAAPTIENKDFFSVAESVRLGYHPGKQRMVIDFSPGSIIDYELSKGQNSVAINLPDSGWTGRSSWKADKPGNLVKSYQAKKTLKGTMLHIELCASCRLGKIFDLPPESAKIGPKLVIDITR